MNHSSLNNFLIVPVLEQDGTLDYKSLKNSLLGHLAQEQGIQIPAILKDIKTSSDSETWAERQWEIKSHLLDITPDSDIKPFDAPLTATYRASLIIGTQKNRVLYLHEAIHEQLKGLFVSPEEMLSYGKFISTEFTCYGAHELQGVHVSVVPDDFREGMSFDGLGFCSPDIMNAMGVNALIQFRAVRGSLNQPGVAKGLLKVDECLPNNTILLTHGCLKGAGAKGDWNGVQDLWVGVLRDYQKPGRVKDSWTWNEIPGHKTVKEHEIPQTVSKAHELMDIISEPAKALEYKGLLDRDEGFSMLDQVLRTAVGATGGNRLPPLTQHPYLALGLRDLMASKLREIAVDGATSWHYLVNTATIEIENQPRAIRTNLFPVGTEVVIRRYPIILRDSWGVVVGPADGPQEIEMSELVQKEVAADHDGDQIAVIECPRRLEIAKKERGTGDSTVSKSRRRLCSTWWEHSQVIASNIGGSSVGLCTYGLLSAAIKDAPEKEELKDVLQASVDKMKWDCEVNTSLAREALDKWGLPSHIAQRHNSLQFKSPDTTNRFEDKNWNACVDVFVTRTEKQEVLPLSAYGTVLFGKDAHGLSKADFRELVSVYRFYCSRIKALHALENESYRQEKIGELFDSLRAWASDKTSPSWICAAWQLCHQQSSRNNRAVFVFEVWRTHLVELLAKVYKSEVMARLTPDSDIQLTKEEFMALQNGLKGKLVPINTKLAIEYHAPQDKTESKGIKSVGIVKLNGVNPEELAEKIQNGEVKSRSDETRPLPGIGANGLDLVVGESKVAEVADGDVASFDPSLLKGEVQVFRNSLKLVAIA